MSEVIKLELEGMTSLSLQDLKSLRPAELIQFAEKAGLENAGSMRKQDIFVRVMKNLAEDDVQINGGGVLEVLQDGFGFLRAPEANYLPGPDDIYVSPNQVRKLGLRTGDTVSGEIRSPRENERYFALTNVTSMNFGTPEQARNKAHFDSLTPLYPDQRFQMEIEDPTAKDISGRIIDIVSPIGKGQRALIVAPPRTGKTCLLYTSPSPRDATLSRMPSSA